MGKRNLIAVLLLAIVIALFPLVIKSNYYRSVMVFVGMHAMVTIGLALLLGYAGQISLGHGAFFGIGAYSSGILTVKFAVNPLLALVMGIVLVIIVAYTIGKPTLKLTGHYLAMATLGFGWLTYIFFNEQINLTDGPSGLIGIPSLSLFGVKLDTDLDYYLVVWLLLLIFLSMSLNIVRSRVGRALRSIGDDEIAAKSLGVDTAKYKIQIFVLSAVYASIAGSLYAHYLNFISPSDVDIFFSIRLVIMVIIGGMTSLWGALIGAAVLTIMPEVLTIFEDYDILIYGAILVLMMVFMPKGLGSKLASLERLIQLRHSRRRS
jgi:branched-chain amino acid transport system permease protein